MIDRLDKITDKAAVLSITRGTPTPLSKNITRVGTLLIKRNLDGIYDITTLTNDFLYRNISVFDVAITISQKHNQGNMHSIKQILYFQNRFEKFRIDMTHYLHCMKGAKQKGDIERLSILEDKFQIAEESAKNIRRRLLSFKSPK